MTNAVAPSATAPLVAAVVEWFGVHERPLPWRSSTPWGVLVSEVMLQQTPVDRVLPMWTTWLERWPTPASLAEARLADVLRAWGRLGYPRRAQRLHESARAIVARHDGEVPSDPEDLRALPGIGEYTAAAVLAFAFGKRSLVLDTNVRRVVARAVTGQAAAPAHITAAERALADAIWPTEDAGSARWSAAVMELGALVCTARTPSCDRCPVADACAWVAGGRPAAATPARRQPTYEGSDRQARGRLLEALRAADRPLTARALATCWPDVEQRERALAGLLTDGLVAAVPRGRYTLPE